MQKDRREKARHPRQPYQLPVSKVCIDCEQDKLIAEFYKRSGRQKGQVESVCKDCKYWRDKDRYRPPSLAPSAQREYRRGRGRWIKIKTQYNLTQEQYEKIAADQGGCCRGCERELAELNRVCIDHDRSCCFENKSCGSCVRGLLCHNCNVTLGLAGDNVEVLERLAGYLRGYKDGPSS